MKPKGPPAPNQPYNRPNKPYVCGRLCEGKPCQFGPRPDGSCSERTNPCKPKWSLRRRRSFFTLLTCLISLAIVIYCLQVSSTNPMIFNPGPLSKSHAKLIRPSEPGQPAQCSKCHAIDDHKHWISSDLFKHDHTVDSEACISCHQTDEDHPKTEQKTNWLKPHGLADAASIYPSKIADKFEKDVHCIQCHREHRGLDSSITFLPEKKCHSCHEQSFNSFSDGHPEFKTFPYRKTSAIRFNHGKKEHLGLVQDCKSCHTYNKMEEKHELAIFEESCSQCHLKEIVDTKNFRFSVFNLGVNSKDNDPSQLMNYLIGSKLAKRSSSLKSYLDKKVVLTHLLQNVLPKDSKLDTSFLKTLLNGCDPEKSKTSLGVIKGEAVSVWASNQQKDMKSTDFFLLNFFARILKENQSKSISVDLINYYKQQTSVASKKVLAYYISELYRSANLTKAFADFDKSHHLNSLTNQLGQSKSDLTDLLQQALYSKPTITLNENEQDLHDELLDLIEGDFDDDAWLKWSANEFYSFIFVEEELTDLDIIWVALDNDDLEDKLSELDSEQQIEKLLVQQKAFLEKVLKKLKSNLGGSEVEVVIQLNDEEESLLEELQDMIESEYDDLDWTKKSLADFLEEVVIEEEYIDTDTIMSSLENDDLEEALDEADDEEIVSTMLKYAKKSLESVFATLKKNNAPDSEKASGPSYLNDYSEGYAKYLKDLKSSQEKNYFFKKPTPQWVYEADSQKVYYTVAQHQDPVQLKLINGFPKTDSNQLSKSLLKNLGKCTTCHKNPSIESDSPHKVWKSSHRKTLHKFKHSPHTENMSMDCTHCHAPEGQGTPTKSGFYPIQKDQCTNCHQNSLAGGECLKCHNYHADEHKNDIMNVNQMIKNLGLD